MITMDINIDNSHPTDKTHSSPRKKYTLIISLVVATLAFVGIGILYGFNNQIQTTQESAMLSPTSIPTQVKSKLSTQTREELESLEEIDNEIIIEAVKESLGLISPSPSPSMPAIPTPSIDTTQKGTIPVESASITSVRLYNSGKLVQPGGVLVNYSPFIHFLDVKSSQGSGFFEEPILLTYTWIIGDTKNIMSTQVITNTGEFVQADYKHIYDDVREAELSFKSEVILEISALAWTSNRELPSLTTRYSFKLQPEINQPNTYSMSISIASDRSQPEILDRAVIANADITLFDDNGSRVKSLKSNGGVNVIRNLSAGTYALQADYKNYGSIVKKVTIGPNNPHGYVFLTVPIKPHLVDDFTSHVFGMIATPYNEFYTAGHMKNQTIRLFRVQDGKETLFATTTTDDWGSYRQFPR